MFDLDIRTLGVLATLSSVLLALGLQIVNRVIAHDANLRLWSWGATAVGAGFILIALRGFVPDLLSIVVANTLLALGSALHYVGNCTFQGKKPKTFWYWWLTGGCALLLLHFTYFAPNLTARIVVVSAVLAIISFGSAETFLRSRENQRRTVRWFIGGAYLAFATFMAFRAASNLISGPSGQDFMVMHGTIQTFAFVLMIVLNFVLGLGLPLLVLGKTTQLLVDSEQRYRTLIEWSPTPTGVHDGKHLLYANPAAVRMFGASSAEELLALPMDRLIHPDYQQIASARAKAAIEANRINPPSEQKYLRLDGSIIDVEVQSISILYDGKPAIQIVANDVTERNAMQQQVRQLAFHDPLTGLPNRRLLGDRLSLALATARRNCRYGALIFLDLDNFKPLNDAHGHKAGDALLVEAAVRISRCVRETDTVARFGGDEFVVMISELDSGHDESATSASLIAEKIRVTLAQPYRLTVKLEDEMETTLEHHCTASIGLALFDGNDANQDDLLKAADMAMYQAKDAGRNLVVLAAKKPHTSSIPPVKVMHLIWHKAYECGNETIDAQHRALFQDANALLNARLCDDSAPHIRVLIDSLMHDIVQHFADEEAIFSATDFPGATQHIAIHHQLINQANELIDRFHAGALATGELFEFLAHTIVARHILHEDREFIPYLTAHEH